MTVTVDMLCSQGGRGSGEGGGVVGWDHVLVSHLQRVDSLHYGSAAGDEILHDQAALSRLEGALDRLLCAVILHL